MNVFSCKEVEHIFYERCATFFQQLSEYGKARECLIEKIDEENYKVTSKFESWIICIVGFADEERAEIKLYHKNFRINTDKTGYRGKEFPDYHRQFEREPFRVFTANAVLKYITHHERQKWGVGKSKCCKSSVFAYSVK